MESKKPLILVSNDDGVMAKGISELVKFLRPLGEIVVMAPDSPRSGSGSALTVSYTHLSLYASSRTMSIRSSRESVVTVLHKKQD